MEDTLTMARLVVEEMWHLYAPIFEGRLEAATEVMQAMIRLEQSIPGIRSIVAEVDNEIVGTAAMRIVLVDDEKPEVDKSLLQELRSVMYRQLGIIHGFRAAILLSYPRYKPIASEAYTARFVITSGYRHLGIAPALFGALEEIGEEAQKSTIGGFTYGNDRRLIRLYRSWGYSETERQRSLIASRALGIPEFVFLRKSLGNTQELKVSVDPESSQYMQGDYRPPLRDRRA